MISVNLPLIEWIPAIDVSDVLPVAASVALVFVELAGAIEPIAVELARTELWNRGKRVWWICPRCGDRRRRLLVWGLELVCRGCLRVTYESRKRSRRSRGTK